jgi:DNA topoisomerase-3
MDTFTFKDKVTTKLGFKAIYENKESINTQIDQLQKLLRIRVAALGFLNISEQSSYKF